MMAILSRIPRPIALWLAGMFCGSVAFFMWVHTFALVAKITIYSLPFTVFETCIAGLLCAIAFPLAAVGFRLFMAGYNSI